MVGESGFDLDGESGFGVVLIWLEWLVKVVLIWLVWLVKVVLE